MNTVMRMLTELEQNLSREVVQDLLVIFKNQMEQSIPLVENLIKGEQFEELAQLAHKLKSSARNVGANKMGLYFHSMEVDPQTMSKKKVIEELNELYHEFKQLVREWDSS